MRGFILQIRDLRHHFNIENFKFHDYYGNDERIIRTKIFLEYQKNQ